MKRKRLTAMSASLLAQVTLNDGRQFDADALFINTDSTSWINSETELSQTFDTRDIHEIRFTNRFTGAAIGFFVVALPIGALGLLATSEGSFLAPSGSDVLRASIVYGLVGAGVGAAIQYKIKYLFIARSQKILISRQ